MTKHSIEFNQLLRAVKAQRDETEVPPNKSLQPTVIPLRGLPAAELKR